ncbi:MAG: transglutaminase-like domain-containing protein, partial [Alkalibacterium sp.]
ITFGLKTEYDIVLAIETYLKEDGGYRYSLLDVETTPQDGDYVDHFLFESQVGYCDNFSTSMTIMLRSLGIPTRWTKGFTPGTLIDSDTDDPYFLVDNSNTHSWPEVFFPSYGWVPFEPSPSFANPVTNEEEVASIRGESYSFDDEADVLEVDDTEPEPLQADGMESDEEDIPADSSEDPDDTESDTSASSKSQTDDQNWSRPLYLALLFAVMAAGIVAVFKWHLVLWLPRSLISKGILSLRQSSTLLLKLYYLKHKPKTGQTVQMYMDEWKPFVWEYRQTFDRFSHLVDRAYYAPEDSIKQMTDNDRDVLLKMLDVFPDLPDVDSKATHQI